MLMVTHGCNLNCTYCYEKFKNGAKRMSIDLAKEIILKEIEIVKADERFEELEVDFMGGANPCCVSISSRRSSNGWRPGIVMFPSCASPQLTAPLSPMT